MLQYFVVQAINFACKERYKLYFDNLFGTGSQKSWCQNLAFNMLAGGFAGATSLSCAYPLDLVRTRLASDSAGTTKQFTGITDCLVTIYRSGGIRELYRGFTISIVGIFLYRALYFGLYDTFKMDVDDKITTRYLLAFGVTNSTNLLLYPFDITISLIMMQSGRPKQDIVYKNSWDCVSKLYTSEGIKGFYKGSFSNLLRGLGSSIVLVLFDELKKILAPKLY